MNSFKEIEKELLKLSSNINGIPTQNQIDNHTALPGYKKVVSVLKKGGFSSIVDFYFSNNIYDIRRKSTLPYSVLCDIWEGYKEKHGRFPTPQDTITDENLPSWHIIKQVCENRMSDFLLKYKNDDSEQKRLEYNKNCEKFIKVSNELGRSPTSRELRKYNLPSEVYFVSNSTNPEIKKYGEFVSSLGFMPTRFRSKKDATRFILEKRKQLGRNVMYDDFRDIGEGEIGIRTITSLWGSFNNMLVDLGLPINQEDMKSRQRSLHQMKNDINKLCGNIISYDDIRDCKWCLSPMIYSKYFVKELNLSLSEYIESIGFKTNKPGMGMIHVFEDGEKTSSKFEFQVSSFLKENNIEYTRDIKYSEFIDGYVGEKNCDYMVSINDTTWYVEIAGMLDDTKMNLAKIKSDIHIKYKQDLGEKEKMLLNSGFNYSFLYPSDLRGGIEEAFSFLENQELKEKIV